MIMHIQSPEIIRRVFIQAFQWYLGIFRDTDTYSATLTGAQLGKRVDASPALFENQNKCPDLGKKDPDCGYLWVKCSIQNVVLRVSWKKNSKMFPYEVPFSCIVDKMFIEVAYFHNSPSPTLKKFWLRICIQTLLYWQNAPS